MKSIKRVKKTYQAIKSIIKNPWLLNSVLSENQVWKENIEKKHGKDYSFPVIDFHEIASNESEQINHFSCLGGGSLITDLALLKLVCRKYDRCKYFEIGTWRGESIVNVSEISEECYTLNLSSKEMRKMGLNDAYINMHGYFIKEEHRHIKQLEGNSMNFDFGQLGKKFDVIFIDGNHHYDYVKNDTEKVFKNLVHDHSTVIWHDYAYDPEKLRYEVMSGILDGIPAEHKKHLYHVSNTMCAIYTKEKYKTNKFTSPIIPNKNFELEIMCKPLK